MSTRLGRWLQGLLRPSVIQEGYALPPGWKIERLTPLSLDEIDRHFAESLKRGGTTQLARAIKAEISSAEAPRRDP